MPRKRKKFMEGYANNGNGFIALPRDVTDCANYAQLSHAAKSLIQDAGDLQKGKNNGNLSLTMYFLEKKGWTQSTLQRARKELLYYEFIIQTRVSRNRNGNLYALGWIVIHASSRHDAEPTAEPIGGYRIEKPEYKPPKRKKKQSTIQRDTVRITTTGEIPRWCSQREAPQ